MIKTNEKIEVSNYPYGFTLKTTLFDTIDFNPKKGYRHTTQTINPKNGRLNAPKSSTYSPLMVRYYDENNHIKCYYFDFNGCESINKACKFISGNIELFENNEIQYFYTLLIGMSIVDMKAMVIYCGAKFDDLKPLYTPFIDLCKKGLSDGVNYFNELILDVETIESKKDVNYNPFR
jgi:hypothetical protein